MESTMTNQPRKGEFFLLQVDTTRGGRGHGVEIENEEVLLTPPRMIIRPRGGGFPALKETPVLVHDPKVGDPPEDLEGGMSGYWLVSDRLQKVFAEVDPEGFAFVECDYRLADGSKGPRYYLCEVTRELDALDEETSTLTIDTSEEFIGGKFYDLAGGASLAFRKEVLADAHVFRTPYSGSLTFCDHVLRDAVLNAGIGGGGNSRGLRFKDAADI